MKSLTKLSIPKTFSNIVVVDGLRYSCFEGLPSPSLFVFIKVSVLTIKYVYQN